jgi:DNA invertase Pin-like site-specific DNA recombinase
MKASSISGLGRPTATASRGRGRKGGRKREFSPAAVRRAQERYDRGDLSVTEIARLAGVSRQTLYRYLNVAGNRDRVLVK